MVVDDVSVFGGCWGCGFFSWGQRGSWWWVWVAWLGALVVHGVGWGSSILPSVMHSSRVGIACGECQVRVIWVCQNNATSMQQGGLPARQAGWVGVVLVTQATDAER